MKPIISNEEVILSCPYFKVKKTELIYPNKRKHIYFSEQGIQDFVVVIGEKDKKLLMVKQYRYPIDGFVLEFPAGGINKGEDSGLAAMREFREETGYGFDRMVFMGSVYPFPARSSTVGHVFVALNLKKTGEQNLDPTEEGLECVWVSKEEFKEMMFSCDHVDAVTLAVWALYKESKFYSL